MLLLIVMPPVLKRVVTSLFSLSGSLVANGNETNTSTALKAFLHLVSFFARKKLICDLQIVDGFSFLALQRNWYVVDLAIIRLAECESSEENNFGLHILSLTFF